jgi:hypothetical protein
MFVGIFFKTVLKFIALLETHYFCQVPHVLWQTILQRHSKKYLLNAPGAVGMCGFVLLEHKLPTALDSEHQKVLDDLKAKNGNRLHTPRVPLGGLTIGTGRGNARFTNRSTSTKD